MYRLVGIVFFMMGGLTGALAQPASTGSEREIVAHRLGADETVNIDGQSDEEFWAGTDVATDFRQVSPVEHADPSMPTLVQVAYTETTLYVLIQVIETRPDHIVANTSERDGPTGVDDIIRIYLDPNQTGRDAYLFEVNANGARWDSALENNLNERGAWNATWAASVSRHDNGWTAEIAIPFRELSLPSGGSDWGFDIVRIMRGQYEITRWAQIDRSLGLGNISNVGRLTGIRGIETGIGLDIQFYGSARATRVWPQAAREDDVIGNVSANVTYKITPSLTGTLTANTDFSDAPLDSRIVSTSRFATFFDETRDFFLQDSAIFEFGGRSFSDESNGLPFFSRNIGFADGQVIDLMAGGKLSGRTFGTDVGALVTFMDDGRDFDSQILGIGRVSRPIFGTSRVGAIFMAGDPNGDTDNYVAGVDFQYSGSLGSGNASADLYFLDSYTVDATGLNPANNMGHGQSYGGVLRWASSEWLGRIIAKRHEEGYNPQLGFLSRPETQHFRFNGAHFARINGPVFRVIENWTWHEFTTDLNSNVQSSVQGANVEGQFSTSDYFGIYAETIYERVDSPFELPGGVIVPADEYRMNNIGWWVGGSDSRMISPHFEGECCELLGGDYLRLEGNLEIRPHPKFSFEWGNNFQFIRLPTGGVDIYVTSVGATFSFTPDMQLITDVQYDNLSGNMNIFTRYRWEFAPGAELFVGLGHNADVPARDFANEFTSNVSTLTVRLGKTFSY